MQNAIKRAADPRKIQTCGDRAARELELADQALEQQNAALAAICLRAASRSLRGVRNVRAREALASEIALRKEVA